jgi:hypothetical protein
MIVTDIVTGTGIAIVTAIEIVPRPQRYVCVVSPPPSVDRRRPYVCNAEPGRVGGRCRCSGVVGSGTLDLDR